MYYIVTKLPTEACLLQGVVTTSATMSIEWFPAEHRSLRSLIGSTVWGLSTCSMSLVAFLLRDHTWRYLQFALSGVSVLALFQWWSVHARLRPGLSVGLRSIHKM